MTLAGAHVRTIGAGVMEDYVYGVAASPDMIAVCTYRKVFLFDAVGGGLIQSFGVMGTGEGQLDACLSVGFTLDGAHVVVAEEYNARLSMFTLTGEFVRCVDGNGEKKESEDELDVEGHDVAFARNGDIVVADYKGHRVGVLSSDGSKLLRLFGSKGDEPGKFKHPCALTVNSGQLYVLDNSSARVQVFE